MFLFSTSNHFQIYVMALPNIVLHFGSLCSLLIFTILAVYFKILSLCSQHNKLVDYQICHFERSFALVLLPVCTYAVISALFAVRFVTGEHFLVLQLCLYLLVGCCVQSLLVTFRYFQGTKYLFIIAVILGIWTFLCMASYFYLLPLCRGTTQFRISQLFDIDFFESSILCKYLGLDHIIYVQKVLFERNFVFDI